MSMKVLKDRLDRKPKEAKDPHTWPFCICCHLAAPGDYLNMPPTPDLRHWSKLITPDGKGNKEEFNTCPDCTVFQITQLTRYHGAMKKKLEKISVQLQAKDKCGLRLQTNLNPFKSSFCCQPKGHLDACR